jgi:prolyl oligopeptidase
MKKGTSMSTRILPVLLAAMTLAAPACAVTDDDPYLWLSDIHGAKAVQWATQQTARSDAALKGDSLYAPIRGEILKSLDLEDRLPLGEIEHGQVYNFWQDKAHVRGVWRRTPVADYRTANPHWETLLDVDAYDAATGKNWVFKGADCAPSDRRCLVRLSPGGGDADDIAEYDPAAHAFIAGGFHLAVAKSDATYLDDDTILFATDFGPGSLTTSSYPRIVKLWHRGQAQGDAKTVFEGTAGDIASRPHVYRNPHGVFAIIDRGLTFFTSDYFILLPDGATRKLPVPPGADLKGVTGSSAIFKLRDAWAGFAQGSLIAIDLDAVRNGKPMPPPALLYAPRPHATVETVAAGRDAVYAAIFDNITGSIHAFRPSVHGWNDTALAMPAGGTTTVVSADAWSGEALFTYESFLVPPTLYETRDGDAPKAIRAQAPVFDGGKYAADQFWTKSKDGTSVPYFLVHAKDRKGPSPTILYSYGGFELSLFPWYWNDGHRPLDAGQVWLARGGAIAVANIRGGGEFGPAWHQAAQKAGHVHAFEDFAAVAGDLVARGVTSPKQLGIVGASNGGLLVTATMVAHPELFGAVVCQRPLIDMLRYTRFGAGASWIDEYGDPADAAARAYIAPYSPYQNVKPEVASPPVLFITETSDDRVTPIFARMMAAKMEEQRHDVLFNEAPEGGHGPGATNAEQADMWALSYVFFAQKLGLGK